MCPSRSRFLSHSHMVSTHREISTWGPKGDPQKLLVKKRGDPISGDLLTNKMHEREEVPEICEERTRNFLVENEPPWIVGLIFSGRVSSSLKISGGSSRENFRSVRRSPDFGTGPFFGEDPSGLPFGPPARETLEHPKRNFGHGGPEGTLGPSSRKKRGPNFRGTSSHS